MELLRRALAVIACGLIAVSCGATGSPMALTTTTVPAAPAAKIGDAAVQVVANGCSTVEVHGAGLMVAPGRIATVAHVVAGAKDIEVRGAQGTSTGDGGLLRSDPRRRSVEGRSRPGTLDSDRRGVTR